MIDNLELIRPLLQLDWKDDDQFYFIQIIARKKDIEGMEGNNRVIKDYYVYTMEYLDKIYPEIQKLCKLFKARAYIRLSKRSAAAIAKDLIVLIGESFKNNNFQHLRKLYSTAVGQSLGLDKYWIVDIDFDKLTTKPNTKNINAIKKVINDLEPGWDKIIAELPTPNGLHIITKPFNSMIFKNVFVDLDVHKNNPTILYSY